MRFQKTSVVDFPIGAVSDFHRNPKILKELTPPLAPVYFHRIEPLNEGSIVEMTIWLGCFPVFWRAKYIEVQKLSGFSDIQEKGPFKLWKHVHRFHDLENGKTEIDDNIEAEFKPGLKGMPGRLIWMGLHMLFYFRHWKTRKMLARFYPNDAYAIQYETR